MAAALYAAVDARGLAQRRSAQSDALVAFMLGDLRQRLVRVGRLDILDEVGRKVLSHYALMDAGALDDMALSKQGEALKLVGSIRLARGDLPGAVQAFGRGATTAHALSARGPNDGPRIFAEAQMIYWLAVVQWRLRRLDLVERGFREYARLADRLVSLDPSRDDWRLETAYARTNLGALLLEQARYGEALSAFMTARAGFEAAASKQPHDADRLSDLVDGRNWTADALYRLGRLDDAYRQRSDAVAMLRRQVQSEPGDRPLVAKTLGAELALSRVALELGRTTEGGQRISAVRSGLAQLIAFDPANMIWLEYAARADIEAAEAAWCASSLPLAMRLHRAAERKIARLKATEGASYRWRPQVEGRWQRQAIGLLHEAGDDGAARQMAGAMLVSVSHAPPNADAGETAALAGSARLALGQAHAAFQLLSTHERSLPPDGVDVFAQAAMADGERPLARQLATQLAKIGYRRRPILTYSGIISLP
jgi:tetratricopeptide (TPR) repeat protein